MSLSNFFMYGFCNAKCITHPLSKLLCIYDTMSWKKSGGGENVDSVHSKAIPIKYFVSHCIPTRKVWLVGRRIKKLKF